MRAPFFLSCLVLAATILPLGAVDFPVIPRSKRVLTQMEVKNYWVNKLPLPYAPSRLAGDYARANVTYHRKLGERHRLIQAIRAGKHDDHAKLVLLQHNIVAYRLRGNDDMVLKLAAELEPLEKIVEAEEAKSDDDDRLERLIAATERLAAAIENNGGAVPEDADEMVAEIIPFERDLNDRRSLLAHLHAEIALCQQPIIVHQPHNHRTGHNQRQPARGSSTRPTPRSAPTTKPSRGRTPASRPSGGGGRVPQQPQVRPARAPQQPQVRPARAPQQPATKPARAPQTPAAKAPRQPQVRQPQVRQAR